MNRQTPLNPNATRRVVYTLPAMETVSVRPEQADRHAGAGTLDIDLYYPPTTTAGRLAPAVLFVTGFPDAGAERMVGCRLKDMGAYVSWGQLAAASGWVGITYSNIDPQADARAVLEHVQQHAASLGIDRNRMAVWACSGNVPNALSVLMHNPKGSLRCAVLCYGYLLDLDGSTQVTASARNMGFVNPCAGASIDDVTQDTPLLLVRAGHDQMPGLNDTLDRFFRSALASDLPVTCMNHARAAHGFDLSEDTEASRDTIRNIIEFMRVRLTS